MSEQQLLPFSIPEACPLVAHELETVEGRFQAIVAQLDAAKEISVWGNFLELLDDVDAALGGEMWQPMRYRDCAARLRRTASKRDFDDLEIRILRTLADRLDRLAESCFHLQARVQFEYLRSLAA